VVTHRLDQLADAFAQQRVRILHRSRSLRIGGIRQQRHFVRQQPSFSADFQQAVEGVPLLLVFDQPCSKDTQTGWMKTAVIQREVQGHFPAQVKQHALHRFGV
jgi:hypothetical protein